jgi:transposase-like protein
LATTRKKGNTGKRYSDAQKTRILAFVNKQGRGGISAAGKKFGVSYIALRRWMNGKTGAGKPGRGESKGIDGRKLKSVKATMASLKAFKKQITVLQRTLKQLAG